MKRIAILGSTGSIGRSTLSVVESFPDRFQVVTLAAGRNLDLAFEQAKRWRPRVISVAAESHANNLRTRLNEAGVTDIEITHGAAGTVRVATHPDVDFVVSAIVGVAGLEATYEAVKAGKIRRPSQQRVPGRCRRTHHRRGPPPGQAASAHRQRAQRRPPVPARRPHERGPPHMAHGLGRPVPEHAQVEVCRHHGRAGAEPSHLEDGQPHHHRLRHPDEQGLRGHRGLPFVQLTAGAGRGHRAPAVHHSLAGRVRGRQHPGAAFGHRHAPADPVRADLSRPDSVGIEL